MNIKHLRKIAKMFGVRVEKNPQKFESFIEKGVITLTGVDGTVECVYFNPKTNKIRLRKPGYGFIDGDFADAICLALTRCERGNVNLCKTIRKLSSQLTQSPV